jgi:putative oxidoreductase
MNKLQASEPFQQDITMSTLHRLLSTRAGHEALLLRVPVGIILAAHGAQKLFGWFGGYGLAGTAKWMGSIGLEPATLMALLAGGGEFFGGLMLILGLFTRLGAALNVIAMAVALFWVHAANGLFLSQNGFEYALALLAATAALLVMGGGKLSLDAHLSRADAGMVRA